MLFCPGCGFDRRTTAPIASCPQCGAAGVDGSGPVSSAMRPLPLPAPSALPGALTTRIPVTPRIPSIVFGAVVLGFGLWAIVSWIPDRRPLGPGEFLVDCGRGIKEGRLCVDDWRFNPGAYKLAYLVAVLIAAGGLSRMLHGATYRAQKEVTCKRCKTAVVGKVTGRGVQCPLGKHLAEPSHVGPLAVTIAIVILCVFIWGISASSR